MRRVTKMPPHDIDEGGVAPGRPHRRHMTDQPDGRAGEPQAQAEADRCGERAVDDHHRAWRATQKQRFGERAMDWGVEAGDGLARLHQTSAPPPNEKNDKKKLEAAKAMESPKTIWIRRRNPPEVSPNASARPVRMMTMTEMTLATGPWIDSSIWLRGCSHGMFDPAAWAGIVRSARTTNVDKTARGRRTCCIIVLLRVRGRSRRSGLGPSRRRAR